MKEEWIRTSLLLGQEAVDRLEKANVAVFGIGGVGSYAAEALIRSGIGTLGFYDNDTVSKSNINRQLIATVKTVGRYKADVMKERALEINPECRISVFHCFYLPETADQYDLSGYDYIIDAIDTITAKLELITRAKKLDVPIISCMGAGNKLNPAGFLVSDIYETSVCPLAKVMRKELRARNISSLKVVYSKEEARIPYQLENSYNQEQNVPIRKTKRIPGSISFVPSAAGLLLASEVVKDLCQIR